MVGPRNLGQLSSSSYNGVLHNLYVAYLYFYKNRNFHICSQLIYVAFPLLRYLVFNISRNSLFFVFKTYNSPSTIYLMRKNKSCLAWYESNVVCQYIIGGGDYCQPLPPSLYQGILNHQLPTIPYHRTDQPLTSTTRVEYV